RALGPAAYRRIQHVQAALGEGCVNPAHHGRRVRGEIEVGRPLAKPGGEALGAERHRLDLGWARQRGEHHLGRLGDLAGALHPDRARREMRLRRRAPYVVHHELDSGLLKVTRHVRAHGADTDEAYLHDPLPCDPISARTYYFSKTSLASSAADMAVGQPE